MESNQMYGEKNNSFMENYFGELPVDLQLRVFHEINHWKTPPPSKFKAGDIVRYNAKKRTELIKYREQMRKQHPNDIPGEMPTGKLIIWCPPRWNSTRREWGYEYEYGWGGTSEGFAYESTLEQYPR